MTDAWAASTDATTFGRIAAALVAADCEHLPTPLDVTALGERRELLLSEVAGHTLGDLLRRRRLTAGEAVTVVLSAARAAAALHAAGYCGVDLADDELRLDAVRRPILFGLSRLRETLQTGAEGPADDWRAVAALAERVGLLTAGRSGGVLGAQQVGLGLALAAIGAAESADRLAQLEDALFDLAEPAPIDLDADAGSLPRGAVQAALPSAPGPRAVAAAERASSRSRALHRRPSASALIEAFDAGPAALLAGPMQRLREAATSARSRLHGRTRVLVIAAAAAVTLTLAVVVLLPSRPQADEAGRPPSAPTRSTPDSDRGTAHGADTAPQADQADDAGATLMGADPVSAASVLIARRDSCLAAPTSSRENCLAQVADNGASDLDQPARALAGLTPSLLERAGDSALIALTPKNPKTAPASALLMRTEAGWRLRQLYEN